jgi:hypothetical protein
MKLNIYYTAAIGFAALCLVFSGQASATSISVNYQTLADVNGNPAVTTISAAPQALTVPGTFGYTDTLDTTPLITSGPAAGYGFIDTYVFSSTNAAASSLTTTINLGSLSGITGLQERLYAFSGAPVLGSPGSSLIQDWTSPLPGGVVLNDPNLAVGTYALEVRGATTGTFGGTYSGALNLSNVAAVPLPAAVWLFGSALAGMASVRRSKK